MNEESAHEDMGYSRKKPWRGVQGYCQLLGCAPVFQGLKAVNDYSSYTGLILGSLQPVALPAPRDPNALYQQADVGGRMRRFYGNSLEVAYTTSTYIPLAGTLSCDFTQRQSSHFSVTFQHYGHFGLSNFGGCIVGHLAATLISTP